MMPRLKHITALLAAWVCLGACQPAPEFSATLSPPSQASATPFTFGVHLPTITPSRPPTRVPETATAQPAQIPFRATPPPADGKLKSWMSPVDGMTLVPVPAGDFLMGTLKNSAASQPDELPQRKISLAAYWIDQTEVTIGMYSACVENGGCTPAQLTGGAPDSGAPDLPAAGVTWDQASAYCQWAGRRLPTEAEWEKAARGKDGRLYPWGWIGAPVSAGSARLNFCDANCPYQYRDSSQDDGFAEAAPVGSFPEGASPYGVLDMAGNVWEWVADRYQSDYYRHSPTSDPQGPPAGVWRVMRGGSWLEASWEGLVLADRAANRASLDPTSARVDLGFRCAAN
jgi:formylglycine-generating enzyme required for sulfatase activity